MAIPKIIQKEMAMKMDTAETIRVKRKYDKVSYTYDIMELLQERLLFRRWRTMAPGTSINGYIH